MGDNSETTREKDPTSMDWEKVMNEFSTPFFKPWQDFLQQIGDPEQWQNKGRVIINDQYLSL